MKITNLSCPSCGGKLAPLEGNPQIMVCEYCGSQFVIENDIPVNYHIHPYPAGHTPTLRENPSSGSSATVWLIAGLCLSAVFVIGMAALGSGRKNTSSFQSYPSPVYEEPSIEEPLPESADSPLFLAFVEAVFEKDAGLVTEEDLARIRYLNVTEGSEVSLVAYSFESPYEDPAFQPVTLWLDPLDWDSRNLERFSGLEKLNVKEEQVSNISFEAFPELKGLVCKGLTPEDVALLLPAPEDLLELSLTSPGSLDGLSSFEHLEMLSVERIEAPDLKQLVPLTNLRSLSIDEDVDDPSPFDEDVTPVLTDYTALSVLTELEHLEITSSALRDFGFLKSLANLTSLSLSDSDAISLEPLQELTGLTALQLSDNHTLLDYSPLESLTNLHTLTIDKSTSQPDPDLSKLPLLEDLNMSGFMSVSFLGRMGGLKHLVLHGCNIDEIQALSGLKSLESLTCFAVWTYAVPLRSASFIDGMTSLKSIDFSGSSEYTGFGGFQYYMEFLGDISNVFNHPGLERLILNNCTFELNPERLQENPSLKYIEMKEVSLKENFYVESYSGMTDIWYDDVSLDERIDFLTRYPNLEELYLDGNQLTDLSFASSLVHLTRLSLRDNYITDLSPLQNAENLCFLDIRANPVSGTIEAEKNIQILR